MAHPQRYPKIMAQSWRPAARYNRLTLAGWSEAIPRYNDATVRAARYVGDILKYVPDDQAIAPRYSFHM
jgi:hypothetical protein